MKRLTLLILLLCGVCTLAAAANTEKLRVVVLTDIENEPDDAMSLVRFLTYSNQWDVEGLIATTSVHQKDEIATWRIHEIVEAYGKVQKNLSKHEKGFPTERYLRSITKEGYPDYGMRAVGEGMDSEGSEHLIRIFDKEDERPVWVLVWGGPNCLAQALWKLKRDRTEEEVAALTKKLRVYTISDQDDSGMWIRKTFPELFYIVSPGYNKLGAYHYATWSGIAGDKFHARFGGAEFELVDNPWLDENIRSKGPLGAQYPWVKYLMEGDTPTFLMLIENGLNSPENPNWGSWGGRYEYYLPPTHRWYAEPEVRPIWTDAMDEVLGVDGEWHTTNHATIWRWRRAFQHDFAARMDWTIKPYDEANHPPVAKVAGEERRTAKVGDRIELSAAGSSDPDGDALSYRWFYYPEAGSFAYEASRTGAPLKIHNDDQAEAWFTVPRTVRTGTMHIILEVTDKGTPSLTRYRRIIIDVTE